MAGETDLGRLLAGMAPRLEGQDWGYAVATGPLPEGLDWFALVRETEGLTVIAPIAALRRAGLAAEGPMARITLTVHSALEAVGLTAAVSGALAKAGISANMVAGFHHDHIFLPAQDAERAMAVLRGLSHA
ncbi:ACT domain-containing protein [Gemmobacter lutimaris]|uniref:ACT domain-containing protein n=1 Tax=Gemmobacter lutimaris TaxID=2306023 RepID=A0A398BPM6_9RHOB|nr:ACT domain-containing protein [Gemmobacter lutimaris]RID91664.1 ACT domain-containing protein [Gemmobacter lutimaris]